MHKLPFHFINDREEACESFQHANSTMSSEIPYTNFLMISQATTTRISKRMMANHVQY